MKNKLSEQLYDGNATLVIADIADYQQSLHPAELDILIGMSAKRAHEFSTGRYCARQALQQRGIENFAVLRGADREPLWPTQLVGSISHCRDLAGAVVANKQRVKSIGLDIETRKQLNPAIARHVCTEQEKIWLAAQDPETQNLLLMLIFSIKEAVFKCVFQATGEHLRFQHCEVRPTLADGNAELEIRLPGYPLRVDEITVHFDVTDTHVYSGASWYYLPAVG